MPYTDIEKRKEASRQHYLRNKEKVKEKTRKNYAKYREMAQDWLLTYLAMNPCVDCGIEDPVVLEFDHRDGEIKEFNIGDAVGRRFSVERIEREVAKCDVRCANCHRRMTYTRAGRSHRG